MRFIKLFVYDSDYSDKKQQEMYSIENPSLEDFEKEIKNINGKNRTGVKLIDEHYGFMAIGCGYYCRVSTVTPPAMSRLMNPNFDENNPDPRQQQDPDCVPFELVLEAAIHYFKTGKLKESL